MDRERHTLRNTESDHRILYLQFEAIPFCHSNHLTMSERSVFCGTVLETSRLLLLSHRTVVYGRCCTVVTRPLASAAEEIKTDNCHGLFCGQYRIKRPVSKRRELKAAEENDCMGVVKLTKSRHPQSWKEKPKFTHVREAKTSASTDVLVLPAHILYLLQGTWPSHLDTVHYCVTMTAHTLLP